MEDGTKRAYLGVLVGFALHGIVFGLLGLAAFLALKPSEIDLGRVMLASVVLGPAVLVFSVWSGLCLCRRRGASRPGLLRAFLAVILGVVLFGVAAAAMVTMLFPNRPEVSYTSPLYGLICLVGTWLSIGFFVRLFEKKESPAPAAAAAPSAESRD